MSNKNCKCEEDHNGNCYFCGRNMLEDFKSKTKKHLQEAEQMAIREIEAWKIFLRMTQKELEKYKKKIPKRFKLNLPTSKWTE